MGINLGVAYIVISAKVIWIRIPPNGKGLAFKRTHLLFSERNGYTPYKRLPFGWRMMWLRKIA